MRRIGSILLGLVLIMYSCTEVITDDSLHAGGEVVIRLTQDVGTKSYETADVFPDIEEFVVEVNETSTDRLFYRKKYADAAGQKIALNAGEHRLFAYYGSPEGVGFNSFYYVAETLFDVKPFEVMDIEATARLANVKVAVKFGPHLALDHKEYYAEVQPATGGRILFSKTEERAGYAPVGEMTVVLYVYVQEGWKCYRSQPVTCQGNEFVTFNVDTERHGELGAIEIMIDRETDDVVLDMKVPGEFAPQEGPSIQVSGFQDDCRVVSVEANPTDYKGYKADIVSYGGLRNCILKIQSDYLPGVPSEVDLANVSDDVRTALENVGLKFLDGMADQRISYVDFSGLLDYIAENVPYNPTTESLCASFSLSVTDTYGNSAKTPTYTMAIEKSEATISYNDYDIWATKLLAPVVKVTKGDPSKFVLKVKRTSDMLNSSVVTVSPASIKGNTITFPDVTGLAAGTGHQMWLQYNGNSYNITPIDDFTTESARQIDNYGFEEFKINTFSGTHTTYWYELWTSGETDTWWAVNSSVSLDKSNSAWYANYKSFPTVNVTSNGYSGYAVSISSVAVADASSTQNWFNSWGNASVGELFIGVADNSGEHKGGHVTDGHSFASRPTSMSFWHKLDSYESDPYYVEVQILDAEGLVIGSAKKVDGSTSVSYWTQVTLPITYDLTNRKADKIYVTFKSSATAKTGSRKYTSLSRYEPSGERNLNGDGIHAGNVLWIDEVKLNY